jgi:hypothetical protein
MGNWQLNWEIGSGGIALLDWPNRQFDYAITPIAIASLLNCLVQLRD